MRGLRADGLPYDDFCLTSLLHSYSNAKPKQRAKAEATFHEFVAEGVHLTQTSLQALARVLGRADAESICARCGVEWETVEAAGGKGGKGMGRGDSTLRK